MPNNKMRLILTIVTLLFSDVVFSQTDNKRLDNILTQPNIIWEKHQTNHFNLFVEANQYADRNIDYIKNEFEIQRKDIIHFLGDEKFAAIPNIIIVDTKEKVKSILGFEAQGFSISESNIVVFLHSENYSLATKHELTHYFSHHIWGKPADNWFSEGLAVYYDNEWSGYQIDSLSKHLKDNNRLFKISLLQKKFHLLNPMITYPQIGSFTGFLLSKWGKAKLKELWMEGFEKTKTIYGKKLTELEEEWFGDLDKIQNNKIDYSSRLK